MKHRKIESVSSMEVGQQFAPIGSDKVYEVVTAFERGVGTICKNVKTGEVKNLCCDGWLL